MLETSTDIDVEDIKCSACVGSVPVSCLLRILSIKEGEVVLIAL